MLYYIIPPIIVVIVFVILIIFLLKKISNFSPETLNVLEKTNKENVVKGKVIHFFLRFLEKFMRKFKLFSLKIHNLIEQWTHSIRERREKRLKEREIMKSEENLKIPEKIGIISKIKTIKKISRKEVSEQDVQPMISRTLVRPELKKEEKSEFEKILVERIAMNPRDIEAYERLGDYYQKQGNIQDAIECFKQVLKLSSSNQRARINLNKLKRMKKQ